MIPTILLPWAHQCGLLTLRDPATLTVEHVAVNGERIWHADPWCPSAHTMTETSMSVTEVVTELNAPGSHLFSCSKCTAHLPKAWGECTPGTRTALEACRAMDLRTDADVHAVREAWQAAVKTDMVRRRGHGDPRVTRLRDALRDALPARVAALRGADTPYLASIAADLDLDLDLESVRDSFSDMVWAEYDNGADLPAAVDVTYRPNPGRVLVRLPRLFHEKSYCRSTRHLAADVTAHEFATLCDLGRSLGVRGDLAAVHGTVADLVA